MAGHRGRGSRRPPLGRRVPRPRGHLAAVRGLWPSSGATGPRALRVGGRRCGRPRRELGDACRLSPPLASEMTARPARGVSAPGAPATGSRLLRGIVGGADERRAGHHRQLARPLAPGGGRRPALRMGDGARADGSWRGGSFPDRAQTGQGRGERRNGIEVIGGAGGSPLPRALGWLIAPPLWPMSSWTARTAVPFFTPLVCPAALRCFA